MENKSGFLGKQDPPWKTRIEKREPPMETKALPMEDKSSPVEDKKREHGNNAGEPSKTEWNTRGPQWQRPPPIWKTSWAPMENKRWIIGNESENSFFPHGKATFMKCLSNKTF